MTVNFRVRLEILLISRQQNTSKIFPLSNMQRTGIPRLPTLPSISQIHPSFCTQCQGSFPGDPNITSTSWPSSLSPTQLARETNTWKVTHHHNYARPCLHDDTITSSCWVCLRHSGLAAESVRRGMSGSGRGSECRSRIVDIWSVSRLWDSACAVCFARITTYQCKVPWNRVMWRAPG